jgi:ProP effector
MVENAPRLDFSGQTGGIVSAVQATHAKQQASRQRGQAPLNRAKLKERVPAPAADIAVEQIIE